MLRLFNFGGVGSNGYMATDLKSVEVYTHLRQFESGTPRLLLIYQTNRISCQVVKKIQDYKYEERR